MHSGPDMACAGAAKHRLPRRCLCLRITHLLADATDRCGRHTRALPFAGLAQVHVFRQSQPAGLVRQPCAATQSVAAQPRWQLTCGADDSVSGTAAACGRLWWHRTACGSQKRGSLRAREQYCSPWWEGWDGRGLQRVMRQRVLANAHTLNNGADANAPGQPVTARCATSSDLCDALRPAAAAGGRAAQL